MCTGRLQYEVLPQAGRRPRPRVPMTALGRRGSGAPLGRDAGPTPTAAVARSKARRKSGAARRRRGLATAAREAPAGLERAPARCRFIGRPGARAEDLSSNMKRETYLRVTHNNSDRGEGPSREASRAWSPTLPHLGRGAPRHLPFGTRTPGET